MAELIFCGAIQTSVSGVNTQKSLPSIPCDFQDGNQDEKKVESTSLVVPVVLRSTLPCSFDVSLEQIKVL